MEEGLEVVATVMLTERTEGLRECRRKITPTRRESYLCYLAYASPDIIPMRQFFMQKLSLPKGHSLLISYANLNDFLIECLGFLRR
jgi:hypothetical protein